MNLHYNRRVQRSGLVSLTLTAAVVALLPLSASAAPNFCTNLSTTTVTINSKISDLNSKLTAAQSNRTTQLSTNRAKWDAAIVANRAKWDANRQTEYTELQAKATTDAEKSAVNTYITSLQTAIQSHRGANNAARATFRSGEDNLISQHQKIVNDQVSVFTANVDGAETTANTSCQTAKPANETIRASFVGSLKTARETYRSDRTSDSAVSAQIKQLASARTAAIQNNDATFKSAADQARTALKAAFGDKSSAV